jgi:Ca2+-binding RTX toxin-like protein
MADEGVLAMSSRNDIEGNDRANRLEGTPGDDEIRGRGGSDTLLGNAGNDRLRGDEGNDTLEGGAGNDRLHGDKGDDVLTGDEGRDRFIFNREGGDDTVTDFSNGEDRLNFTNFNFASVDDLLAQADQVGTDVVFTLNNGVTVTLENTQLSSLDQSDILI